MIVKRIIAVSSPTLFLMGVTIPAAYSLMIMVRANYLTISAAAGTISVLLYFLVIFAIIIFAYRNRPISNWIYLFILSSIGLVQLFIISIIDAPLVSDFLKYWTRAGVLANKLEFPLGNVTDQRAFPIYLPLNVLFGDGPWVYRVFNVAALLTSVFLINFLGRLFLPAAAVQAASILPPLSA